MQPRIDCFILSFTFDVLLSLQSYISCLCNRRVDELQYLAAISLLITWQSNCPAESAYSVILHRTVHDRPSLSKVLVSFLHGHQFFSSLPRVSPFAALPAKVGNADQGLMFGLNGWYF